MFAFPPYHLLLKPDQTWTAELSWHYSNKAAEIDQKDVEEVTFKVLSRDGETYKISIGRKLLKTELPGVTVDAPASAKTESSETTVQPGRLFALPPWTVDTNSKRLSKLFDFGSLPAVETWQVRSEERGLPATETTVDEAASAEPSLRVWRWDFRELSGQQPMKGIGYLWTRKSDGLPIAMHIEAQNAFLPGGMDPTTLTLDLRVRLDSRAPEPDKNKR